MNELLDKKFVDHPAPSTGLMALLMVAAVGFVAVISIVIKTPPGFFPSWFVPAIVVVLILFEVVLGFSFWLLHSTYYTIDKKGIRVRYGPSNKYYRWEDFSTVHWRNGMFTVKIGWHWVTPCVRLSNAVALHRKNRRWPLYLTPNDPRAFLDKITLFAPELTQEMIL